MHHRYGLCGAALLTALMGCAGAERPAKVATHDSPSATAASDETPSAQLDSSREFQLIDGTLACMISWRDPAPASPSAAGEEATPRGAAEMEEAEATQAQAAQMEAAGSAQCASTADALGLSPAALAAGEQAATDRARRVIRTLLSANDVAPDVSQNLSALFDRGVSAIESERSIRRALQERRAVDVTQSGALRDLDRFARDMKLSAVGAEAQALVWILGAARFAEVPQASAQKKILAGQPLVSAVLDTPASSDKPSMPASWNQYMANAVRALRSGGAKSGQAIGGGPPSTGEDDDVRLIVGAAKARMVRLTTHLAETSAMRAELTRAAAQLDAFTEGE